jgi:hypothetical protein
MDVGNLTLPLPDDKLDGLLEDWRWLVEGKYSPVLMTAFGDLFLRGETGAVYFLDVVSGEFTCVAKSVEEFEAELAKPETADQWLMAELVLLLREKGVNLHAGQCYGYKIPPVLGGQLSIENIEPTDLVVHHSISGQIHRQTKDLPPGTPISGFTVDGDER